MATWGLFTWGTVPWGPDVLPLQPPLPLPSVVPFSPSARASLASLTPTVPTLLTNENFARRLADLFPSGWASEEAKRGGNLYALYLALASGLSFLLGSPQQQTITIEGTATAGDVVTLTITNSNFSTSFIFSHRVLVKETLSDIANALAYSIGASPELTAVGVEATVNFLGSVITLTYPIVPLTATWSASIPLNVTTVTGSTTFGATEIISITPFVSPQAGSLQYAAAATRIQTALNGALDLAATDYLGAAGARYPGEPDAAYRVRTLSDLLPTGATRSAVSDAIGELTGFVPRIVEPWNPVDTGVCDGVWEGDNLIGAIYSDVDLPTWPGRSTDPGLRYQAFIDTIPLLLPVLKGNPLLTADDGLYTDAPGSSIFNFLGSVPTGEQPIFDIINKTKTLGTVIWVRFQPPPTLRIILYQVPGFIATGSFSTITAFSSHSNPAQFTGFGTFSEADVYYSRHLSTLFNGAGLLSPTTGFSYGNNLLSLNGACSFAASPIIKYGNAAGTFIGAGIFVAATTAIYGTNPASFSGVGAFPIKVLWNDGGVLVVDKIANYPTSPLTLPGGAIWSNGGVVSVVPMPTVFTPLGFGAAVFKGTGTFPGPFVLYFGSVTAAQLLDFGGAGLPLTNPGVGTGQLWNNGGVVCIA